MAARSRARGGPCEPASDVTRRRAEDGGGAVLALAIVSLESRLYIKFYYIYIYFLQSENKSIDIFLFNILDNYRRIM